jgi:hypothetical protein
MARTSKAAVESKTPAKVAKPGVDFGKAAAESKAAAKRAKAAPVDSEFDELSNLAQATKVYEDDRRAEIAGNNTYIKVLQPGTDIITKGTKAYISKAEAGDFLVPISDGKFAVRETLRVTVLGMFKLFAEKQPSGVEGTLDQTKSFWLPEDAEQIPLAEGDNFKRVLSSGNYLQPIHWLFVYLPEFPEIKNALIPFQSIGNSYYDRLVKLVKANSSLATELVLDLKTEAKEKQLDKKTTRTNFYVIAEVAGRNYDYDAGTGKVRLTKDGMNADELKTVLELSGSMNKEYSEHKLVSKRSQQQLLGYAGNAPIAHKGLPGSTAGGYKDESEESESQHF